MTIQKKLEEFDKDFSEIDMPIMQRARILIHKLWEIADEHNTTAIDILRIYISLLRN